MIIEGNGICMMVKISIEQPQRQVPRPSSQTPPPKFDVVSWDHNQNIPTGGGYTLKFMGRSVAMFFDGVYWTAVV